MQLALTHGETRANEEHRAIAAAARAGDVKKASHLMRDHIAGAGRSLLVFLRESREADTGSPTRRRSRESGDRTA
jgi:DNA-binding GntR family transcriptional regulator